MFFSVLQRVTLPVLKKVSHVNDIECPHVYARYPCVLCCFLYYYYNTFPKIEGVIFIQSRQHKILYYVAISFFLKEVRLRKFYIGILYIRN